MVDFDDFVAGLYSTTFVSWCLNRNVHVNSRKRYREYSNIQKMSKYFQAVSSHREFSLKCGMVGCEHITITREFHEHNRSIIYSKLNKSRFYHGR